jgi:exodeoxyribonuclease VII small subunit
VVAAAPGGSGKRERPPYEQARDELTELVKRLEAGGLTLEQSLQLWERGEELAAICEDWLEGARARLTTALAQHEQAQHEQVKNEQAQHGQAQERRDRAGRDQGQQDPGAPF